MAALKSFSFRCKAPLQGEGGEGSDTCFFVCACVFVCVCVRACVCACVHMSVSVHVAVSIFCHS